MPCNQNIFIIYPFEFKNLLYIFIVDNNILAALQNELLPLATIEKIQVNQTRDETVYKAEMLINFYSRESWALV